MVVTVKFSVPWIQVQDAGKNACCGRSQYTGQHGFAPPSWSDRFQGEGTAERLAADHYRGEMLTVPCLSDRSWLINPDHIAVTADIERLKPSR